MKKLTRILPLCAVLTVLLCVTAAYAADGGAAVRILYQPTVGGHSIGAGDLDGLEEIALPVQVSSESSTEALFFASFYGANRKFVGAGATTATVDSDTSFVIMPIQDNVTGAESVKVLVTDADFRPLSNPETYSLIGGGGGGSAGNYDYLPTPAAYYLKAVADVAFEDGGTGAAYITETEPTADMPLPETPVLSATFQRESRARFVYFTYYVIFTPGTGSELSYPRIVQGRNAESVAKVDVTLNASPASVVYRVTARSSSQEANAPTVTMKGAFRNANGGGGSSGGGSSGGGGGSSSSSSTAYYLQVGSAVTPDEGGWTYVAKTNPGARNYKVPASPKDSDLYTSTSRNVPAFAIFVANDGYELASVIDDSTGEALDVMMATVKDAENNDVDISYVVLTQRGGASRSAAPTVSVTGVFHATGGGSSSGGGGSSGGYAPVMYYYLQTVAEVASENGGTGAAYVAQTMPVELPQTPVMSLTLSAQTSPQFVYYAVFTPGESSEFVDANVTQGNASLEPMGAGLIASSPSSVVYRVVAFGSPSPNQPPAVITGTFRSGGGSSSGGGGSSSGGGIVTNRENETPILSAFSK